MVNAHETSVKGVVLSSKLPAPDDPVWSLGMPEGMSMPDPHDQFSALYVPGKGYYYVPGNPAPLHSDFFTPFETSDSWHVRVMNEGSASNLFIADPVSGRIPASGVTAKITGDFYDQGYIGYGGQVFDGGPQQSVEDVMTAEPGLSFDMGPGAMQAAAVPTIPNTLTGWIWMATLDAVTCASCWALDGTYHTMEETLDDHPCGRCIPYPSASPDDAYSSQDAFDALSEKDQISIMGHSRATLYQAGLVDWSDMSSEVAGHGWGKMRSETPVYRLKQIAGVSGRMPSSVTVGDIYNMRRAANKHDMPLAIVGGKRAWVGPGQPYATGTDALKAGAFIVLPKNWWWAR